MARLLANGEIKLTLLNKIIIYLQTYKKYSCVATVNINTDHKTTNISKEYRFTIFESHTDQLKEITDKYKFGDGIWWSSVLSSVIIDIKDA